MNHDMAKSAYKAGTQNFVLGITYWLIVALLLTLGFGQLLRFEFFSVPFYLHDVIVICILLLQGLTCDWRTVLKRNSWLQAKKGSPAGERTVLVGTNWLFFLALAISSLRALTLYPLSSLLIPSLYMFRVLAYLIIYFQIKKSEIKIPKIYFLIAGFTALLIGLTQYILLPDMRIFQYLGWDDHLSRLTLPHFDPTFTGVILSLFLLSIPALPSPLALLTFIAILLTYSRSVWLSLILTFVCFIKNKLILLFAVSCMLLAIFVLPQKFGEGTNLFRTYSISSRANSDLAYVQRYAGDVLFGRGMNTLILDTPSSKYVNHATGPNNSYLYLLVTTGILGLVGWGMFIFSLYQKSVYKPMMIFFLIASLFNNVMFYPFTLLWVLLLHTQKENI